MSRYMETDASHPSQLFCRVQQLSGGPRAAGDPQHRLSDGAGLPDNCSKVTRTVQVVCLLHPAFHVHSQLPADVSKSPATQLFDLVKQPSLEVVAPSRHRPYCPSKGIAGFVKALASLYMYEYNRFIRSHGRRQAAETQAEGEGQAQGNFAPARPGLGLSLKMLELPTTRQNEWCFGTVDPYSCYCFSR